MVGKESRKISQLFRSVANHLSALVDNPQRLEGQASVAGGLGGFRAWTGTAQRSAAREGRPARRGRQQARRGRCTPTGEEKMGRGQAGGRERWDRGSRWRSWRGLTDRGRTSSATEPTVKPSSSGRLAVTCLRHGFGCRAGKNSRAAPPHGGMLLSEPVDHRGRGDPKRTNAPATTDAALEEASAFKALRTALCSLLAWSGETCSHGQGYLCGGCLVSSLGVPSNLLDSRTLQRLCRSVSLPRAPIGAKPHWNALCCRALARPLPPSRRPLYRYWRTPSPRCVSVIAL